jgi:uncharacterized protein
VSEVVRCGTMGNETCGEVRRAEGQFSRSQMLEFPASPAVRVIPMFSPSTLAATVGLLICSTLFMTLAWYGHLKNLNDKPWWIAALVSWGIALFEYLLQVPANRIGFDGGISLAQLKITQEMVTLAVFVPFSMLYMGQPFKLNYVWAGLCILGAAYFIFFD